VTIVDDDYDRAADAGLPATSEITGSAAPPGGRAAAAVRPLRAAG
jgi:hypothetical protein